MKIADEFFQKSVIEDIKSEIRSIQKDCRDCEKWKQCECGEKGHNNGTSIGYSIGECKDFKHISRKENE